MTGNGASLSDFPFTQACMKNLCTNVCHFYTRTVYTTKAMNQKKNYSALDMTREHLEVFVGRSNKLLDVYMMKVLSAADKVIFFSA